MLKNIELELPNIDTTQENKAIKELQHNIDMQLKVLQDRLKQEVLIDLEEVKEVLNNTKSIIDECYSTPNFKPNIYKKFSILSFEYQRLSLRYESANAEEKFVQLSKKATQVEERTNSFEGDLKNHLGTLVGLFLTFTLIPTAITGITMIDGKYILPFVATLILFGMLMITFVYILNHISISKATWVIISIMTGITFFLWSMACFSNVDISLKETNKSEISIKIPREMIENSILIDK